MDTAHIYDKNNLTSPAILIVRLGSLGDIIHTMPGVSAIRKAFPFSKIYWVAESRSSEILNRYSLIDGVIKINTKKWRQNILKPGYAGLTVSDISSAIKSLRKKKFDIAIDFQGLIKSGLIAFLSGAKETVGFDKKSLREPLSSIFIRKHIAPLPSDIHIIQKNLSLLKAFGINTDSSDFRLNLGEIGAKSIRESILKKSCIRDNPGTFAGIYPGAGWITKQWGSDKYASLAEMIKSRLGIPAAIIGGVGEERLVNEVANRIESEPPLVITGTSIRELAVILNELKIFIGGDTGPLHLAAALGTPTAGIYGPSSPERNGPYWGTFRTVQANIPCKDCYKRKCGHISCMKDVSVEEVFNAVEEVIRSIKANEKK